MINVLSIRNDPRGEKMTVQHLGNIVEGKFE